MMIDKQLYGYRVVPPLQGQTFGKLLVDSETLHCLIQCHFLIYSYRSDLIGFARRLCQVTVTVATTNAIWTFACP